jgi:hypothetical protein
LCENQELRSVADKRYKENAMACLGIIGVLLILGQVPPPALGAGPAGELDDAKRSIIAVERAQLQGLARRLAHEGNRLAADRISERLPRPTDPDGPTRFLPLPEIVPACPGDQDGEGWQSSLKEIKSQTARELFNLARRAAKTDPPSYSLASVCLHAVLEREPDHKEARRLLGYVPHDGGWAKSFAVEQMRKGLVNHRVFGWMAAEDVLHLDRGELPAPALRGQKRRRWLPAAEADALRADFSHPWTISTEHFQIKTNVPMAEATSFGRRIEAFHDLFTALFADILGESLPLARRFKSPTMTGEAHQAPHSVYYFGSRSEYLDHLIPSSGSDIATTLGYYDPPKSGSNRRGRAYFFRDPNGDLPVTATLYHEVSHQLLFENAGPNAYTKNVGNYWVFEGLGTYFETVSPQPDGSLLVGGLTGPRVEAAFKALVSGNRFIPIAEFVALDQNGFNNKAQIHLHYQQAMALAVFLEQWHEGVYRDAFRDYVRDAYRGRIKHGAGRSLQSRLGQSYATLGSQFLDFLKKGSGLDEIGGKASANRDGRAEAAKPAAEDAIRTVVPH